MLRNTLDATATTTRGGVRMNNDLDSIIRRLEQAQELLYKGRYDEAKTAVYDAKSLVQFLKDAIVRGQS